MNNNYSEKSPYVCVLIVITRRSIIKSPKQEVVGSNLVLYFNLNYKLIPKKNVSFHEQYPEYLFLGIGYDVASSINILK